MNHIDYADRILCWDSHLTAITFNAFWQDVEQQAGILSESTCTEMALWEADSYDFLVLFFAVLTTGKTLILPPNRVPALEKQLQDQNIYFVERQTSHQSICIDFKLLEQAKIVFFTSGSTGKPKQIVRYLKQLLNEVTCLEQHFYLPKQSVAIATVSHQHIYGLLFKLLWPLHTGRSFYREQLLYPEYVVQMQHRLLGLELSNYLISSPALLKRWSSGIDLTACESIFSSGGKLDSGIRENINVDICEILGSSETGGIAYKKSDDALWSALQGVEIGTIENQQLRVRSTHAMTTDWVLTGDRVDLYPNQCFKLLGRVDRIVKLEEKRLSLDAIECAILQLDQIEQCHVLMVEHEHRQVLACVAVLSDALKLEAKPIVVAHLKKELTCLLEKIAIPRRWRFLSKMPINSQSKINHQNLKELFDKNLYPMVLSEYIEQDHYGFELEFLPDLLCFKGHFPNQPVYPGVGQIAFVDHFAKQIWSDLDWCCGYEQLKFQEVIQPNQVVILALSRKAHKVSFKISINGKALASGRFVYECQI
ncbi:AMP-binding protein [Acinetobacter apis]|nr:AMP-binding protein [Acinetobacter apis]